MLWQNSWYGGNLLDNGGMNFELRGTSKVSKEINLAKGATFVKGAAHSNWKGLADGHISAIAPFAHASEASSLPYELVLDLGEEKQVNAFRAYKAVTSAFNGIQVEYSTDNETFTPLEAISTAKESREIVLWSMETKAVRYVKIKFINNYSTFKHTFLKDKCVLAEFEVLKL